MQVTTIGLDLAKHVFQVHGVDAKGAVVLRKRLGRSDVLSFFAKLPACRIGMEACATAHHWARELKTLGHDVRLMPPSYVRPYVKRGKNDAADAEAICEASPTMRFVPVKSAEQQSVLMLHRARDLLIRQRTMLANALRAHLAELGLVTAQGISRIITMATVLEDENEQHIPPLARIALRTLATHIEALQRQIRKLEKQIVAWCRSDVASRRLATIPGVGPITATAIAATVTDPSGFRSGRQFAAWLGLVPRQNSSGGKDRLGGICKQGDRYIRRLLVIGAHAVAMPAARVPSEPLGSTACSIVGRPWSPQWRSPTRRPGLPGPSWRGARPIVLPRGSARKPSTDRKGEDEVMAKLVEPGSRQPVSSSALQARFADWDPIRAHHQGRR